MTHPVPAALAALLLSLTACGAPDDEPSPDGPPAPVSEACPPDRNFTPGDEPIHDARLRRGATYCVQPPILFAVDVTPTPGMDPLFSRIDTLFPSHAFDSFSRTMVPRAPHAGPYAGEPLAAATAAGHTVATTFTVDQISANGALFFATVVTPERGAPIATPEDGPEGYVLPSAQVDALEWHGRIIRDDNGTLTTISEELISTATPRPVTLSHLPIVIPFKVDPSLAPGLYAVDVWVDEVEIFTGNSLGTFGLLATFTIE